MGTTVPLQIKVDFSATDGINSEYKQEPRQSPKDARPARRRGQSTSRRRVRDYASQHGRSGGTSSYQPTPDRRVRTTHQENTTPAGSATTKEGHNTTPQEGQPHLGPPRDAETRAESNRAREHGPHLTPREERNEATLEGNVKKDESIPPQQGIGEQTWEQRFKGLQQELSHVKEVVKGRVPDSMDTLVQQTESPFKAEVLHFPLLAKFRMLQIEAFDGAKDPVDHLNTYKDQMELHGYQDPIWCKAFAITLKGPVLAWFNRLPPSSASSFRELSIAFVFHFIGARTYRKPSYHLLTIKQSP